MCPSFQRSTHVRSAWASDRLSDGGVCCAAQAATRNTASSPAGARTTITSPEFSLSVADYNESVIEEFRANRGKVGGHWEGRDLLLLTTIGRKSGRRFTTPMVYTRDGERLLVYASNGGARDDPNWFRNVVANPQVTVEVGADTRDATATPLEGEERDRKWAEHTARWPHFADYEREAGRTIPVVALVPQRQSGSDP